MTEEEFESLKRRFGDDIAAWPAPYRQEAHLFLAREPGEADIGSDARLDRIVLESALAETDEQAIARKVLARIDRGPVFRFPLMMPSWRLPAAAAGFAIVLVAAGIAGYSAAGSDLWQIDRALLALATGEPAVTDIEIDWPGNVGQEDLL
ncbi:hypothetical protein [Mesorhizobium australicum]|uniref:Uncharacterized protein n=1 Tax=Mesorhizobium australicum TaxID=536018 RepID=A0A1X7PU96_9HYPH|nr:hypothetical protein [Mesorhizobium australicum]SMH54824.1 hypothetical protein SAMN02982922_5227 [Mesorhizobium australicum]